VISELLDGLVHWFASLNPYVQLAAFAGGIVISIKAKWVLIVVAIIGVLALLAANPDWL
jgi:hypothetical protein